MIWALAPVLDGELAVTAWLHSTWSDAPHMLALLCFHVALISYWADGR